MSPNIGLLYSGGINGPVGYGWTLQGISLITRCPTIKGVDGVERGVGYNTSDKLCLDGQRLIQTDASGNVLSSQINDSLGGSGMVREYRTEKDMYARIRAYGTAGSDANNGPAYFKVWTKSGQIFEYGVNGNVTANAQITAQGKSVVTAWPVSRISDTVGNYIDFQYEQRDIAWGSGPTSGSPLPGHEWNLLEIRYTGNGAQAPTNKVSFLYEDRAATPPIGKAHDRAETYHLDAKNVSVRRLIKIQTFVNANTTSPVEVRAIKLTYENGAVTNRSRLKQIAECTGDEIKCLPPVTFNYADGGGSNYTSNAVFKNSALSTLVMRSSGATSPYSFIAGDFNGDGKTDIIRVSDTPSQNQLYFSNGDGGFTQTPNFNITGQNLYSSQVANPNCATTADFNGDGLTDILTYGCDSANYIYIGDGSGAFTQTQLTIQLDRTAAHSTCVSNCSTTTPAASTYAVTAGSNFYVLDFDGDGKADIVTTIYPARATENDPDPCAKQICSRVFKGVGDGTFTEIVNTNIAHVSLYSPPVAGGGSGTAYAYPSDFNGDGLVDLKIGSHNWISRGDGNFDLVTVANSIPATFKYGEWTDIFSCDYPLDFNGDGRTDCLYVNNSGVATLNVTTGTVTTATVGGFNLSNLVNAGTGIVIADIDGDGRSDIVRWNDNPALNNVYLSNGDGTFRVAASSDFNLLTANDQLGKSDGSAVIVVGDFTGHGNAELLRIRNDANATSDATRNLLYTKTNPTPSDQLLSVTSGTGLTTSLTWVPLSNSSSGSLGVRYASDLGTSNAAAYPKVDLTMPLYVVATTTSDSGVGSGKVVTEYSYAGLKAAYDGRGSQGFRETRRQNPTPDGQTLTVSTQHLQDMPYTGVANLSQSWIGALNAVNPVLLSRTTNIYCDKTAATGAEASATSDTPCSTTAYVQRPYLYQTTEEGWDPTTGTALPVVTTTNTFNTSGDPTQIVGSIDGTALGLSQTFTKTTTNTYQPNNISGDTWILGRLQKATVQSSVPNSLDSIAASAGSAPNATAIQGNPQILTVTVTPNPVNVTQTTTGNFNASASVSVSGTANALTYAWTRIPGPTTRITATGGSNVAFSAALAANETVTETFKVTVTDTAGVTGTANVPVTFKYVSTATPPSVALSPNPLTVNRTGAGTASGTVMASVSGGTAPYSYSWSRTSGTVSTISSNTVANPVISAALTSGQAINETWQVKVTDAAAKTATASVSIAFTSTIPVSDTMPWSNGTVLSFCFGQYSTSSMTYSFTISGGSEAVTVSPMSAINFTVTTVGWTNGATLSSGTYQINVQATTNGTQNSSIGINFAGTGNVSTATVHTYEQAVCSSPPVPLGVSISPNPLTVNAPSAGTVNGTLTATASGGRAPYSYSWTHTGTTTASSTTAANPTISATVGAGQTVADTWTVTVTDGGGGTVTQSVTTTFKGPVPPLAVSVSPNPLTVTATTAGTVSGTLTASPSGGTAPYSYSWTHTGTTTASSTTTASPLISTTVTTNQMVTDTWTVKVTDNSGSTLSSAVSVTFKGPTPTLTVSVSPNPLTVNATTAGTVSGTLTASPSGGTAPYSYSWTHTGTTTASSTIAASPTISATVATSQTVTDSWTVKVTDSKGSTASAASSVTFKGPAPVVSDTLPWANGGTVSFCLGQFANKTASYSFTVSGGPEVVTLSPLSTANWSATTSDWSSGANLAPGTYHITLNATAGTSTSSIKISFAGTGHSSTETVKTVEKLTCP